MVGSSSWDQRSAAVLSICLAWSGCYSGEFDPELDGIYACVSQDECPDGFRCSDAVCQDDRGPALVIQGPEKLQIFDNDDLRRELTITVRGAGLSLAEPGGSHVKGQGYIELRIDGEEETAIIDSGFVESSIAVGGLEWPKRPGIHRIEAIARRNDGRAYDNPSARVQSAFWIDDGRPHVAIIAPLPGVAIANGEAVDVEIQTINFDLVEPGHAPETGVSGHAHLFVNKVIPACLEEEPTCNGGYVAVLFPPDTSVGTNARFTGELATRFAPGDLPLSVVLQSHQHEPYPSSDPLKVVYDSIAIRVLANSD